jgi:hypothetical protein
MTSTGRRQTWLPPLAAILFLASAIFIEVASVVQAIRHDSWAPIFTTAWLPAVVLASRRPGDVKACRRRLRGPAGTR